MLAALLVAIAAVGLGAPEAAAATGRGSAGSSGTAGVSGPPTVSVQPPNSLPGIDVSHWQGTIDWTRVAADGQRFVIAKATEGRNFDDPMYATYKAGATAAGLAFTAYHFARPDATANDAILEADHFVDVAQLGPGNLIPALDIEVTGGLDPPALTAWVLDWLQEVTARLGVKPMVYTSPNGWKSRFDDTTAVADAGYTVLWVAHWNVSSPTVPASDWAGNGWTFWQHADCGDVPGIGGCVDLDWYDGTAFGPVTIRGLTVSVNSPDGVVTSAPAGISCGATCSANFDPGATVTLTATPNPGAAFVGWGGACGGTGPCTVAMAEDRSVTATFGFALSASVEGPGTGSVSSSPAGIDCGAICQAAFPTGATVTLTPAADPGSEFSGWSGDCTGSGSCVATMTAARAVTATFVDDTPPSVTLATPVGLTGAVTATFDEIVHQVTPANVVLRVAATNGNVPATLTCISPKGVAVSCSTGNVVTVLLEPTAPLVPGQSYSAIVDPAGAAPQVIDRGGNPAPATSQDFGAQTEVEQGSPAVRYRWRSVSNHSAYGGSYAVEHLAGAEVSFTFDGRSVTWYTVTGPSQGKAAVSIDGRSRGTFDQYASGFHYKVGRRFTGLTRGTHTITVTALGQKGSAKATDRRVAVDAFEAGSKVSATPPLAASWKTAKASGASGGSFAESDLAGSGFSFRFRGTGVDWYTILGPDQGRAKILVDGKLLKTVDGYAKQTTFGARRSIGGLADGVHTVRIVVLGESKPAASGSLVSIDRFVVR